MIELFELTTDPERVARSTRAGVAGFVVDWERRGKRDRQAGFDTQINVDTPEDLIRVRRATPAPVVCRVNPWGPWSPTEMALAVDLGADEVLLPMVRRTEEVEAGLEALGGRGGLGVMVETVDAVAAAGALLGPGLARAYVGLHDLMIDRGASVLFEPLVDGTVEGVAAVARSQGVPFGVAGLTRPGGGHPLPCRLLVAELARLGASFTFLRRSFHADVGLSDLDDAVAGIASALAAAARRPPRAVTADRAELAGWVAARRRAQAAAGRRAQAGVGGGS